MTEKNEARREHLHDNVVDGNVDELDEEADEAHDGETDSSGERDLLEFYISQAREQNSIIL